MNSPFSPTEPVFQCVPNFSEGRRPEVLAALVDSIRATPGAVLLDHSADPDHNRCVLTYLGNPEAILAATLAVAQVATSRIDLSLHQGVHPRTGAMDVLPVVPLRNAGREEAVTLAHALGSALTSQLHLTVFYYDWAAPPEAPVTLPELRKRVLGGDTRHPTPDTRLLTTPGIVLVGARGPLVAYNINLETTEVGIAKAIAKRIREEREQRRELSGVRALGLFLTSQHCAQVSMNLTQPTVTPLPEVFDFVTAEAKRLGVTVRESEVIGVIPEVALGGQPPEAILWHAYRPSQILEI